MSGFTLDTSGVVVSRIHPSRVWEWSDLTPFQQGYVAAALRAANEVVWPGSRSAGALDVRFSDLAPETLAAMLKDCEALMVSGIYGRFTLGYGVITGSAFWRWRQEGKYPSRFPPLALHLGDDGGWLISCTDERPAQGESPTHWMPLPAPPGEATSKVEDK